MKCELVTMGDGRKLIGGLGHGIYVDASTVERVRVVYNDATHSNDDRWWVEIITVKGTKNALGQVNFRERVSYGLDKWRTEAAAEAEAAEIREFVYGPAHPLAGLTETQVRAVLDACDPHDDFFASTDRYETAVAAAVDAIRAAEQPGETDD